MKLQNGTAHVYGDNIDTDAIIPGKYTKTLNLETFAAHVLEDLDPGFRNRLKKGDILVAGDNFGCGSSREQAPLALKVAGISAVLSRYFARIFFRNAINIGLPVFEISDFAIHTNDDITIDIASGSITNHSTSKTCQSNPMPKVMMDILEAGGLVSYLKKNNDYIVD